MSSAFAEAACHTSVAAAMSLKRKSEAIGVAIGVAIGSN